MLNETTGIDYETDLFVKIFIPVLASFDVSNPATYNVVSFSERWPRIDGGKINGAAPDIKYFKKVASERPTVDHRYQLITTQEITAFDPEPESGLPIGEYIQIHTPQKLSVEALKLQVEAAFQTELRARFPDSQNPAVLIEAADAIARKQAGATLTTGQTATLSNVTSVGDAVSQLRAKQAEFNAAIDSDADYDLTDWTISE